MDRSAVVELVLGAVSNELEVQGVEEIPPLDEETPLIGEGSPIDSLGLVSVIVEVEQRLLAEHGVSVTLVDEKAMSQRNSPFRTVGALASYAVEVAGGGEA
jgi:acyl carrier protein